MSCGRRLVVPRHLAGLDVDGDERAGEQVVTLPRDARVARRRVAGAEDVQLRFGIVDAGDPDLATAVACGLEARPRVEAGVTGIHRDGIELPLELAGLRIEGLQEAGRVEVVSGSGEHVVADDHRRHGREVLLVEIGDFDVPALLAGPRIERDQVVVRRLEVEIVVPHPHAAAADVGASLRLPVVVPELAAVARVDRPRIVRRRDVEHAADLQDRSLDVGVAASRELAAAFTADDHRRRAAEPTASAAESAAATGIPRTGGELRHPCEREVLDVRLVDLRQCAVAPAGVVA